MGSLAVSASTDLPVRAGLGWPAMLRRRRDAVRWLRELGLDPDPDRVEWLLRGAGRFRIGTHRYKLASELIERGVLPTPDAVSELARRRALARSVTDASAARLIGDPELVAQVCAVIEDCWSRLGTGPSWAELRHAFGWTREETSGVVHGLSRAGVLAFTRQPRSLCVLHPEHPVVTAALTFPRSS